MATNLAIADLTQILEEELAVGAELRSNLDAQKAAILGWDVAALLERVEAREAWLGLLGDLEAHRQRILSEAKHSETAPTLSEMLASADMEPSDKTRLANLGERARHVFTEIKREEEYLFSLMGRLHGHMQEALSALVQPSNSTYGEKGVAETQRPASALLRSRA
jgi:hypothetical protein